jgi:hypothetical protein
LTGEPLSGRADALLAMVKEVPLKLKGAHAKVVDRMVDGGMAQDDHHAVEVALLAFGKEQGLLDEADLLRTLRRQAAADPLSDRELADSIRRAVRGGRA